MVWPFVGVYGLERNRIIFYDCEDNLDDVWDIRFWVAFCLCNVKDFIKVLFSDLVRG